MSQQSKRFFALLGGLPGRLPKPLRPWVLPGLALLCWALLALEPGHGMLWTSPTQVAQAAQSSLNGNDLWPGLLTSLRLNLWGLLLGCVAGLSLGATLGSSRLALALCAPSLHVLKQVSLFAWLPLLSLWFGLGDMAKLCFVALSAFFPMALHTLDGIQQVPSAWLTLARTWQFTRWQLLTRVLLPAARPSLATGLQLATFSSWLATLGADYLLPSGQGLGQYLIDARDRFEMDRLTLGILAVALVGLTLNVLVNKLAQTLLPAWQSSEQGVATRD